MKKAIFALWRYFKSMNSETTGGISIKRNVAWILLALFVFGQAFPVVHLRNIDPVKYIKMVEFLAVLDAAMLLLVLGITSIEKLADLYQRIKGGLLGGNNAVPTTAPTPEKEAKDA